MLTLGRDCTHASSVQGAWWRTVLQPTSLSKNGSTDLHPSSSISRIAICRDFIGTGTRAPPLADLLAAFLNSCEGFSALPNDPILNQKTVSSLEEPPQILEKPPGHLEVGVIIGGVHQLLDLLLVSQRQPGEALPLQAARDRIGV